MNRIDELAHLEHWWAGKGARMGLLWGRKRVGKTALLSRFAQGKRAVFHTGRGGPLLEELATLASKVAPVVLPDDRDLEHQPFAGWADVLRTLARAARREPVLLVLDEFPELYPSDPTLSKTFRAVWDEARTTSNLRILLCGSAVRTMQAINEERSDLHGRFDLSLALHPFRPHEAALLVPDLSAADRARVWGICGGTPLYLSWWDTTGTIEDNVRRLACTPGGLLRTEGELVLATEGSAGGLTKAVLTAIAVGKNRHHEIVDAVRSERRVASVLTDLEALRLVDRVVPVTDDPRVRTGRTTYRLADNFLAFWLGPLSRYLGEIDRGLGRPIAKVLVRALDDHMGPRYEEAFREHLRRLSIAGDFGDEVTGVGQYWTRGRDEVEIDAVVLAGRPSEAVCVGEAKWAVDVDAAALRAQLTVRARALPRTATDLRYAVCARERVLRSEGVLAVTAADIFGA